MAGPALDLYRLIHKGIRRRLFSSIVLAGTTDVENDRERERLRTDVEDLCRLLRAHAAHEERFIHPLLKDRLPRDFEALEGDHARSEEMLAGLLSDPAEIYESLTRFAADCLVHLEGEESIMPRLRAVASEEELRGILASFKASRTPAEGVADLRLILPALSAPEIADILVEIRTSAPAGAFDDILRLARDVVSPHVWEAVGARLRVPS